MIAMRSHHDSARRPAVTDGIRQQVGEHLTQLGLFEAHAATALIDHVQRHARAAATPRNTPHTSESAADTSPGDRARGVFPCRPEQIIDHVDQLLRRPAQPSADLAGSGVRLERSA
jgi:hypothetical protein